jgi:hypothetical protein
VFVQHVSFASWCDLNFRAGGADGEKRVSVRPEPLGIRFVSDVLQGVFRQMTSRLRKSSVVTTHGREFGQWLVGRRARRNAVSREVDSPAPRSCSGGGSLHARRLHRTPTTLAEAVYPTFLGDPRVYLRAYLPKSCLRTIHCRFQPVASIVEGLLRATRQCATNTLDGRFVVCYTLGGADAWGSTASTRRWRSDGCRLKEGTVYAGVAQLVERLPSKQIVDGSRPFTRSSPGRPALPVTPSVRALSSAVRAGPS